MKKSLKWFFVLLFFAWFGVGVLAGLYNNFIERKQCIENEGVIKGILWCTSGAQNYINNMLLGFLWPAGLFISTERDMFSSQEEFLVLQDRFRNSKEGVLYTCWEIAINARREEEEKTLYQALESTKLVSKIDTGTQKLHSFLALQEVISLIDSGEVKDFYSLKCIPLLRTLKNE